jgi:hypothetical protein
MLLLPLLLELLLMVRVLLLIQLFLALLLPIQLSLVSLCDFIEDINVEISNFHIFKKT